MRLPNPRCGGTNLLRVRNPVLVMVLAILVAGLLVTAVAQGRRSQPVGAGPSETARLSGLRSPHQTSWRARDAAGNSGGPRLHRDSGEPDDDERTLDVRPSRRQP